MSDKLQEETNRLLRTVIAVLIDNAEENTSLRDKVSRLSNLGLTPSEIADILGRTSNYVNKELSELRKLSKSNKR